MVNNCVVLNKKSLKRLLQNGADKILDYQHFTFVFLFVFFFTLTLGQHGWVLSASYQLKGTKQFTLVSG